jgi:uncharacterized membrane protein YccF (DUF307 family)
MRRVRQQPIAQWAWRRQVDRRPGHGRGALDDGAVGHLGNLIWFLFAGWWLVAG